MADDAQDTGSERATVRLVAEMVKGVGEQVDSLKELTRYQHIETQRRLDEVAGLPAVVNGLIETMKALDSRQTRLEKRWEDGRNYRMSNLPMILLAFASVVVAIVTLAGTI